MVAERPSEIWRLQGYDTFAREWYDIPGWFFSEEEALAAAYRRLEELEEYQPSRYSGGQYGIQDQVFIVRPDGTMYRVWPKKEPQ